MPLSYLSSTMQLWLGTHTCQKTKTAWTKSKEGEPDISTTIIGIEQWLCDQDGPGNWMAVFKGNKRVLEPWVAHLSPGT